MKASKKLIGDLFNTFYKDKIFKVLAGIILLLIVIIIILRIV